MWNRLGWIRIGGERFWWTARFKDLDSWLNLIQINGGTIS
jgi:hypothetical protein